ncbi:MAG: electron transfer flavoprotein subunit beta/FixA family protein [candidate division WOR-3 bacterium]|nr:electron transfer flavoprotein subunit beta/FixA family protein [candidate division WOR-3 bacterium]MCX7837537.1 electron transfer flavoprotein subunit beta/FixA family protein [candidate division WOR-3 bacterium]
MKIIVCIKSCPETAESEIKLTSDKNDIIRDKLVYTINESDNYALETALVLKEKYGGEITLITFGDKKSEDILRMGFAKGADYGIRIEEEKEIKDPLLVAQILALVIKNLNFDLILTGITSSDRGYGITNVALAKYLNLPFTTLVKKVEKEDNFLLIERELEGGLIEKRKIKLPCLLTIQTGIYPLRYASILAVKRAVSKEIKLIKLSELNLELKENISLKEYFIPKSERETLFLKGSEEEIADNLIKILKEKGIL